ncbi:TetR/AcrR family transcriptional regulator [Sandaracinobacteroides hominis]|uniref:TetR/AcrR family transcriptional regulator n=1 Tax=Sandaracinobacteroides hominis TaxID=2780086 RepID=UPI0018F7A4D2|nr:TetR/AcrR family transcriptional regulator [Sandaracinobacteroides hominis]
MEDSRTTLTASRDRRLTRRGADTREKILQATITCIVRSGFSAMTVENVMAQARISRGSVLHQFPNRMSLAVETVARSLQAVMQEARLRAERIEDPFARLADYARIVWETHAMPAGLALTEILQAARWDAELAAAIRPFTIQSEEEIATELAEMARLAGFRDPQIMVARGWLLVASARGLIIESRLGYERPMISAAIEEMKQSHRRFCETMVPLSDRIVSGHN